MLPRKLFIGHPIDGKRLLWVRRGYGALHNNIAIGSSRKLRKALRKGASLRSITGTSLRDFLRTRDFKRIAEDVALTYDVGLRG